MTTGATGGNDDLLERKQRALDRQQFSGKDDISVNVAADGISYCLRLLIYLLEHEMLKGSSASGLGNSVSHISERTTRNLFNVTKSGFAKENLVRLEKRARAPQLSVSTSN
jgi:hypothetical protein